MIEGGTADAMHGKSGGSNQRVGDSPPDEMRSFSPSRRIAARPELVRDRERRRPRERVRVAEHALRPHSPCAAADRGPRPHRRGEVRGGANALRG